MERGLPSDLCHLTIAQAAKLIEAREISPVELTRACLDRIDRHDSQIKAFITVTSESALDQARAAERAIVRGEYRESLHGIPYALKDIYETQGVLTTGGSRIARDYVPKRNAAAVERLTDAGAILLGKLATHEFAAGGPAIDLPWPPARNPWDTSRFTGGSSSGAGAAIAAGFIPFAMGTDTGGSIRTPAGLCGVAGLKPTYGRVSHYGVMPNSFTLDHCGPMAWTVEDCAIVLQSIAGHDKRDPTSSKSDVPNYRAALGEDLQGLRIGLLEHFWNEESVPQDALNAIMHAADVMKSLGATIENARMRTRQEYNDVKTVIAKSDIFAVHHDNLRRRAAEFGRGFLSHTLPGCLLQACDYVRAQRVRRQMLEDMQVLFDKYDVLLTANSGPAPTLASVVGKGYIEASERPSLTGPFSVTGGPALAVCTGYTNKGLPLSMQLAGRPFDESTVLRAGYAYEQATQWRQRRPILKQAKEQSEVFGTPASKFTPVPEAGLETFVHVSATRAGLTLTSDLEQLLLRAAPGVIAAVDRLRSAVPECEPANIFRFPS